MEIRLPVCQHSGQKITVNLDGKKRLLCPECVGKFFGICRAAFAAEDVAKNQLRFAFEESP